MYFYGKRSFCEKLAQLTNIKDNSVTLYTRLSPVCREGRKFRLTSNLFSFGLTIVYKSRVIHERVCRESRGNTR